MIATGQWVTEEVVPGDDGSLERNNNSGLRQSRRISRLHGVTFYIRIIEDVGDGRSGQHVLPGLVAGRIISKPFLFSTE